MNFKKQIHFTSNIGRMGNQMFQYACAKELEHAGFVTSLSHLDLLSYFKLSPLERISNRIRSFLFFRLWKNIFGISSINTGLNCMHQSYREELQAIDRPTTVWGVFQSPLYFPNTKELIKKHFTIKDEYKSGFAAFLKNNGLEAGKYLAVHIRQTDYKGFVVPGLQGDDFTLPVSYYTNALSAAAGLKIPIVFVSDHPDNLDELFPDVPGKIISRNDAITDFLILQQAAAVILSNSTYAWWAAFLNPFAGGKIYCPKYFLGFKEQLEVPVSIYPEDWIPVSVF